MVPYDVQKLASNSITQANCGLYAVKFIDKQRNALLEFAYFNDGLVDPKQALPRLFSEPRKFIIKATDDLDLYGSQITVEYSVSLRSYP